MQTIQSLMTANPACCQAKTPLAEVARLMKENDCGQIPVVDSLQRPVGVVTDRDIALRIVGAARNPTQCCASDAMTAPARTIGLDADIGEGISLMESLQIRRLPVVDASGALAGMLSIADIAQCAKPAQTAEVIKEVSQRR